MSRILTMLAAAASPLRSLARSFEEWWFDTSRHVRTAGDVPFQQAGHLVGDPRDSVIYIPARVANARAAFRDLPLEDPSCYTFVDLGSGKGRMLFVAAEYPFRRIIGVEFSTLLHEQARANLERYHHRAQKCRAVELILGDAAEYAFPPGNLVLYMFNPFGAETIKRVLANLERSLQQSPRHVVVVLLWPENGDLVAGMRGMHLYRATRRHQIYQTSPLPQPGCKQA